MRARAAAAVTFRGIALALVALGACVPDGPRASDDPESSLDAHANGMDAGTPAATQIPCGDRSCTAPAVCVASLEAALCRCPIGYLDLHGDGSDCRDVDECIIPNICDRGGKCTNTQGSYECECATPTLTALGNHCVCASGYLRGSDGRCLAQDGKTCTSDQDCLNHHCEGGTCCAVSCDRPAECHTADGVSCKDGETCSYPAAPDGTACDDAKACTAFSSCKAGVCGEGKRLDCDDGNPCTDDSCAEPVGCRNFNNTQRCDDGSRCTTDDVCQAGQCTGTAKSCSESSDSCNAGSCAPETGECGKLALPDGTPCDDQNLCTQADHCTAGSCGSELSACGADASGCNETDNALRCTCADGFIDNGKGRCVPSADECRSQSACSPDADCTDPSNASGDFVCTCKPGFTGDGMSCSAIDPCKDNPCGENRGSCQGGEAGSYSCACQPGYVERDGSCVCALSGIFAARSRFELTWDNLADVIEPGNDALYSYAIERLSYDAHGNLQLEHTACGDGSLDLCGSGSSPSLAAEAYAQYVPSAVWELPSMPKVSSLVHKLTAVPGAAFESDPVAHLLGIRLTDPLGPWPPSLRDIAGTPRFDGGAVNGARWLDHDDDGFVGLTSYVVPPGGVSSTADPAPPRTYGSSSPVCPRSGGPHTPYAYLPSAAEGPDAAPVRIKRFYMARRLIGAYRGKLANCDVISGDILGAGAATLQLEMRIGGCIRQYGDGETACSDAAVTLLDDAAQGRSASHASFTLKRWPSQLPLSCDAVRNFQFD